jgi:cell division protein ZapE
LRLRSAYQETLAHQGHVHDSAQEFVVDQLADLQVRLLHEQRPRRRLHHALRRGIGKNYAGVTGVYLWGDVGRGKTFLMDLFFATLPIVRKKRIHFHRMMADVHERLNAIGEIEDPLDAVAADIAHHTQVLCFDEFFVSDIADAMMLGRFLDSLFRRGVTLVATSNSPPSQLYANGLQRERFLPAIELLEARTQMLHLDGDTDYRLRLLREAGTYLTPADDDANAKLSRYFREIASGDIVENRVLDILGRGIRTDRCAKGVAWFDLAAICDGPRSQADYIEIARWYPTVIVSNIPVFDVDLEDQARRFIALVDEFYDRNVKLLVSAATPIASLYTGRKLTFEFRRTT